MNLLDLLVVLLVIAGAIGGYRLGFVARVTSWLCMAIGLLGAVLLLAPVLERFPGADSGALLLMAAGMVFLGAFGGQAVGLAIGARVRPVHEGAVRATDRVAGAVTGVVGVLVLVWLLFPVVTDTRGWPAEQATSSTIAMAVHDLLPEPPDAVQTLRSLVGDGIPRVFEDLQPTPDPGPPPPSSGLDQAVTDQVVDSVVKVEGEACNRIQDGSGFVVAPGTVVTNAHVVAGEETTEVITVDGEREAAVVVAFDPARDLAVLRVPELDAPPLPVGDAEVGDIGGVFGYPGGGDLRIAPFAVVREISAIGRDIYDDQRTERQVLELAANLAPGDSGAALVSPAGQVVGVAFAVAPDRDDVAYALTTEELEAVLAGDLSSAVSTGPCT